MLETLSAPDLRTLSALIAVIVFSLWLGMLAQRVVSQSSFLKGFFLGNRGLGAWAMALTATVQSGGTFMGFPSLVYSHGWVVALWIGSYMVVPITGFAVLAKRLAQLSRRTGAITVPDLLRERFNSPALGILASLLITFFLALMLIAQFKAGAIVMKFAWVGSTALESTAGVGGEHDAMYYLGLTVFSLTVVAYTVMGGFLASVWTDLFQSVLMLVGVVVLFFLAVPAAGGLEEATRAAVERAGPGFAFGPGMKGGGSPFLPLGLAVSMFFVWIFGGLGSPTSLVRVMASSSSRTLSRSIVILSFYNLAIYLPLIVICVAARGMLPAFEESDEVVPRIAMWSTRGWAGGGLLTGLILAAPFGAVMSTVSSYMIVIASAVVRDLYNRFFRPGAGVREMRFLSAVVIAGVGLGAVLANIYPVDYLQMVVVRVAAGQGASFVVPALLTNYWRRATAAGMMASMTSGALTVLALLAVGVYQGGLQKFEPYYLLGLDPVVWGLAVSAIAAVAVSLCTRPPPAALVSRLFDARGAA